MTAACAAAKGLPRESQEPVLQFAFAKRLAYRTRMTWALALVAVGMAAQLVWLSVLPGVPFLVVAVALSWVVGFDNALDRRGLRTDRAWRRVPFERIPSIVKLDIAMKRWDASAIDLTSPIGFLLLAVTTVLIVFATVAALVALGPAVALIVAVDAVVLVLLQWFSGMRTVHRKPDLVLKAGHIQQVVAAERAAIDAAGELHGQLLLPEGGGDEGPADARILIDVADPPGKLLSVQGQVVLNRVQGTPHAYFYCVVVAFAGDGLADFAQRFAPGGSGTTIEVKTEDDMDVVVVRQTTSKTSGYETKAKKSRRLLVAALDIATAFRDAHRTAQSP